MSCHPRRVKITIPADVMTVAVARQRASAGRVPSLARVLRDLLVAGIATTSTVPAPHVTA